MINVLSWFRHFQPGRSGAGKETGHIEETTSEEPVGTGQNPSAPVHPGVSEETNEKADENLGEPVHTGSPQTNRGALMLPSLSNCKLALRT